MSNKLLEIESELYFDGVKAVKSNNDFEIVTVYLATCEVSFWYDHMINPFNEGWFSFKYHVPLFDDRYSFDYIGSDKFKGTFEQWLDSLYVVQYSDANNDGVDVLRPSSLGSRWVELAASYCKYSGGSLRLPFGAKVEALAPVTFDSVGVRGVGYCEVPSLCSESDDDILERVKSDLLSINCYLQGNFIGYTITDYCLDSIESIGGFVSIDDAIESLKCDYPYIDFSGVSDVIFS